MKDGGPAYPVQVTSRGDGTVGGFQFGNRDWWHEGLSMRDLFACHAISAFAWNVDLSHDEAAKMAYEQADAMLAAREVQP